MLEYMLQLKSDMSIKTSRVLYILNQCYFLKLYYGRIFRDPC